MSNGNNKLTFTESELKLMRAFGESQIAELDKFQAQMMQDLEQTMRQAVAFASSNAGGPGESHNIILKRLYEWQAFFKSKTQIYLDEETLQPYNQKLNSIFSVIEWRIEDMKKRQAAIRTHAQTPVAEPPPAKAAPAEADSGEKKLEDMTEFEFQWHIQQKLNAAAAERNRLQREVFWKSRGVKPN